MTMWTARRGYIAEHRAALVDFLEDYLRALRWITAPENQGDVVQLLAEATKLPPERFAGWVYTASDQYRDPAGLPDLAALQASLNIQYDLGFIKRPLDIAPYVDLSLIKEAGARFK
jgi:NitT/TauT family transport system substrate-binding protein